GLADILDARPAQTARHFARLRPEARVLDFVPLFERPQHGLGQRLAQAARLVGAAALLGVVDVDVVDVAAAGVEESHAPGVAQGVPQYLRHVVRIVRGILRAADEIGVHAEQDGDDAVAGDVEDMDAGFDLPG